jgi:hypothetical protein
MDADLGAVLDSPDDYETKSANLAKVQMKYSDLTTNPAIRYKLDAAKDAIIRPLATRPLMTPAQEFQMGQEGVDPAALGGSPFAAMGLKTRQAKSAEEQKKLDAEAEKQRDKEMYDLLNKPIEFEKSDDLPDGAQSPQWLKPESHQVAKLLATFGKPDEQKKFEAAGLANDDVTRANIARDIRLRMLQARFNSLTADPTKDPLKLTKDEQAAQLINKPLVR